MKVKICGQTSLEDAEMSVKFGADFLGVVLDVEWSSRSLSTDSAFPIFEKFRDRTFLLLFNRVVDDLLEENIEKLRPYALQLTGQEGPEDVKRIKNRFNHLVFKSIHLEPESKTHDYESMIDAIILSIERFKNSGADGIILDTAVEGKFGGTGVKSDWSVAKEIVSGSDLPVFLAGGINPDNVALAASIPGIYGIDLVSGTESRKGKKSEEKLKALFENFNKAIKDQG
ncbi:hypothetical protein MNBD_NITROSPINAE02-1803 [hydrothermal vent metagenome]|uniref:phosphoribosylanthranilate isomerase n=1 Tax=hydrothermal vent metagenome TaxID=652676 RepID=A0A3B1CGA9_9ZZZZ